MINFNEIKTLEEYLCSLGCSAVTLDTLSRIQSKALALDILDSDEREQVEVIRYELKRTFNCIQSLLTLITQRSGVNIEDVVAAVDQRITKSPE